ncbi:MAG: DegT/DnrJ/EryC1/StrS family aminotransferase [Candidatus Ozemobacteraceae bacterium]
MTSRNFLPFALPDIGEEEIQEVVSALRSGWLTTGPKTKEFEKRFAEFFGDESLQAISVNSATAGLHLALEALDIKPGDEIITTPYTFTATAEIIRYLGAHPVFVDVHPDTLNIDVSKIPSALTSRTRGIIPVHFAGLACEMDQLAALADDHQLSIIEDAAHAFPTTHRGRLIGTLPSAATVFSFYATKTITTGEGGMILTRSEKIAERCRLMRLHGINRDVFDRYTSTKPKWYYEIVAPGFKYNLTDVASSIGIHQLRKANQFHQRRQAIASQYRAAWSELPLIFPQPGSLENSHAWHLFVIRLKKDAPLDRDTFIEKMAAAGVGCSVHFIPLHLHPYWRDAYHLSPESLPNATAAYQNAVSIPIYTKMTEEDVAYVISTVTQLLS